MKLKELKKQMKEKTEDYFPQDRKDWVEQLCVVYLDEEGGVDEYYDYTSNIYICKDREDTWEPTIYWVKVSKKEFESLIDGLDKDTEFGLIVEWGNDSGMSSRELVIRSVTEYYVYLSPVGWEDGEDE